MTDEGRRVVPWARVAAEFLAIFAGVTLSFAAEDWRQQREERAQEIVLLEGLRADLDQDSADIVTVWDRAERYDHGSAWLQLRFDQGDEIPVDSIQARYAAVVFGTTYQPVTTTYVALRDGGQMSVIGSDELRRLITAYYEVHIVDASELHRNVLNQNRRWREVFRPYWDVPLADASQSHSPIRFRMIRPWRELREDAAIRAQLVELGISGGVAVNRFQRLLSLNRELSMAPGNRAGRLVPSTRSLLARSGCDT